MGVSVKAEIRAEIDTQDVQQAFDLMMRFGRSPSRALQAMGRYGKSSTQMRFRTQTDPQGHRWKPSKRVEKHGGMTLRMTSRLRNSLAWQEMPGGVEWGTNVVYAAAHQFGVDKKVSVRSYFRAGSRKKTTAAGARIRYSVKAHQRQMKLPRRAFLGVNEIDRMHLRDIVRVELMRLAGHQATRFG